MISGSGANGSETVVGETDSSPGTMGGSASIGGFVVVNDVNKVLSGFVVPAATSVRTEPVDEAVAT